MRLARIDKKKNENYNEQKANPTKQKRKKRMNYFNREEKRKSLVRV